MRAKKINDTTKKHGHTSTAKEKNVISVISFIGTELLYTNEIYCIISMKRKIRNIRTYTHTHNHAHM